jgi:hypothetical protein
MIDTLLKTGRYCSKAHASRAILQAPRTAGLQAARCQHKSPNSKKKKLCNNQPINFPTTPTTIPRMISMIADDGAYNIGRHWGGMEEQLAGECQNNVICGLSLSFPTSLWNDGDDAAEQMERGKLGCMFLFVLLLRLDLDRHSNLCITHNTAYY